jgi:hypothetical protein
VKISVLVHVEIDAGCDAIILKASNKYFYFTALEFPFTIHVYISGSPMFQIIFGVF